jgi:hypothetical protein
MKTIKTTLRSYYFNIANAEEKTAYNELVKTLKAKGLKCFETWGGNSHYLDFAKNGIEVELETKQIFDNQWNTAPIEGISSKGLRVFDWAMDACLPNKNIKRGHYLEITEEIVNLRNNTLSCGYCGHQESKTEQSPEFCPHCIGSEYLEKGQLYLTRLQPVSYKGDRKPLTESELAELLHKYIQAQTYGNNERDKARLLKQRTDLINERDKQIKTANVKHDGMMWFLDNGIKIDNVIYYPHIDRFSFGWRSPVSAEVVSEILNVISEFPFLYEIKCQDGRTLQN